jgi:prolipoprotein diacylglyceryl transferase
VTLAAIPSPTTATWNLGPIPIRAYALFIILGIIVACVVTEYRLRARGVHNWAVLDIAVWAVPSGIIGARIYHVITSPDNYFGEGGDLLQAFRVWEGGLGIWGAIAGGALGVWLGCRQMRLPFLLVADAAAVGIPLAQAVGRLGNWFNNELYGSETSLPWGLEIYRMVDGRAVTGPDGEPLREAGLYHPTFLYELLWNVGVALLVLYLGRRLSLGRGRAFALYVMAYTAGRFWIELLRIDDTAEQPGVAADTVTTILGQRVNVWVSLAVFLGALAYFLRVVPMARGPQEFVVPLEHGSGYRVVTEQEFRDYAPPAESTGPGTAGTAERAGESPAEDAADEPPEEPAASAAEEPAAEPADGDGSAEVGSSSASGSGNGAGSPRTDDK